MLVAVGGVVCDTLVARDNTIARGRRCRWRERTASVSRRLQTTHTLAACTPPTVRQTQTVAE
jgi:hypothetical protein